MAVDKLVDSTQLDTDLTSVANAIRTKGGTSASLSFPSGFVSAIGNIPSGNPHITTITIASDTGNGAANIVPILQNFVPQNANGLFIAKTFDFISGTNPFVGMAFINGTIVKNIFYCATNYGYLDYVGLANTSVPAQLRAGTEIYMIESA